jgi:hypothetical protein
MDMRIGQEEHSMNQIAMIGPDISKSVFRVRGIDAAGGSCSASIEAPSGAAVLRSVAAMFDRDRSSATTHHWGRQLIRFGMRFG